MAKIMVIGLLGIKMVKYGLRGNIKKVRKMVNGSLGMTMVRRSQR
jgi:hypothetical protein